MTKSQKETWRKHCDVKPPKQPKAKNRKTKKEGGGGSGPMRQALVRLLCGYPPLVPRPKSDPIPIPNPRQPRPPRKPDGGGLGGRPPDPQTTQTPGNPDPQTNLITLRGADWAGGLPRGRGASAAPAPLAAAGKANRPVERPTTEPLLMLLDLDGD